MLAEILRCLFSIINAKDNNNVTINTATLIVDLQIQGHAFMRNLSYLRHYSCYRNNLCAHFHINEVNAQNDDIIGH